MKSEDGASDVEREDEEIHGFCDNDEIADGKVANSQIFRVHLPTFLAINTAGELSFEMQYLAFGSELFN